ncbi:MAG: hypothetical protein U0L65_06830 [Bacteroidales bacterium]|jgi:hypothetical protein|nr:hypothetical protein [Bacteroidales bacterium]MEE1272800.1 hypothetical protein [Bacteroidales bacterium]
MKKIIGLFFAVLFSAGLYAQEGVIKFLGIPVDGTKQEMIEKLKSKGFTYDQQEDALQGEFNGEQVSIQVQTQNNKVWRLCIFDTEPRSEGQIKIRFNKLVGQFENNSKYTPAKKYQTIDEEERIGLQILGHDKQYNATFIPKSSGKVWFTIKKFVGRYIIASQDIFRIVMYYENTKNEADGSDL